MGPTNIATNSCQERVDLAARSLTKGQARWLGKPTAEIAQAKLKAKVDGRVLSLEPDLMAAFTQEQQRYDDETKHGTDRARRGLRAG